MGSSSEPNQGPDDKPQTKRFSITLDMPIYELLCELAASPEQKRRVANMAAFIVDRHVKKWQKEREDRDRERKRREAEASAKPPSLFDDDLKPSHREDPPPEGSGSQ